MVHNQYILAIQTGQVQVQVCNCSQPSSGHPPTAAPLLRELWAHGFLRSRKQHVSAAAAGCMAFISPHGAEVLEDSYYLFQHGASSGCHRAGGQAGSDEPAGNNHKTMATSGMGASAMQVHSFQLGHYCSYGSQPGQARPAACGAMMQKAKGRQWFRSSTADRKHPHAIARAADTQCNHQG